jgi:hypothetical protein
MKDLQKIYFRFETITKEEVLETQNCIAIGFLNIGNNPCRVNGLFPVPTPNGNLTNNMVFFPINSGERDATRYKITFLGVGVAGNNCLVCFKELST